MKFIFPQNYHFKNKILGVIDYTTAFVNLIWYGLVFLIVNILFSSISVKVVIFILLCFPLLLFSFSGFNGENIVYVFIYMTKYIFRQKLYLYGKNRKKI
mgnify:CR=1 FL=1|jgi:hypothetical protein